MDAHPSHLKRLSEAAGVAAAEVLQTDELEQSTRIPEQRLYDLLERLVSENGDDALGLELVRRENGSLLSPVAAVCETQDTVEDALTCAVDYHCVVAGSQSLRLVRFGTTAVLDVEILGRTRPAHHQLVDVIFGSLFVMIRRADPDFVANRLVTTRKGDGSQPHRDFFETNVEFGAKRNRLFFDADVLGLTLPSPDDEPTLSVDDLERQRDELTGGDIVEDVRRVLTETSAPQHITLAELADEFGISERTLQRRMRRAGETLQNIRDDIQRSYVHRHLRDEREFSEIAELLGYSELSAFYRAFKRWFGVTPTEFRRRLEQL